MPSPPLVEASNDFLQVWTKVVQPQPWLTELEEFDATGESGKTGECDFCE
jgi:hypothetical protein